MDMSASVADFISTARVGHLGTADARGRPLVVPFCYVFDGVALYSAVDGKLKRTAPDGLRRIRNVRENPQVCVVIDHYEERWERLRHVIIHGRAEILRDGPDYGRAIGMLTAKYPQYRAVALPHDEGVMIKVTPERVTHWSATG
jgi:PPOX class probable F420-dependent enzyme